MTNSDKEIVVDAEVIEYASDTDRRARPPIAVAVIMYVMGALFVQFGFAAGVLALAALFTGASPPNATAVLFFLAVAAACGGFGIYAIIHTAQAQAGRSSVTEKQAARILDEAKLDPDTTRDA